MKEMICVLLVCCFIFAGCAGRKANPVPLYLPGDENLDCTLLKGEISQLQTDMEEILPHTSKGVQNTACVVGGVFLIVPFFFMDLSNADKVEFEAMRQRHNRLLTFAQAKGCDLSGINTQRVLSIKEYKRILKEYKRRNPDASGEMPVIQASSEHELVYDQKTKTGYISVRGKGLEARPWMIDQIEEFASFQNVLIKAGEEPEAGYYRILDEDIEKGTYTIEFQIVR